MKKLLRYAGLRNHNKKLGPKIWVWNLPTKVCKTQCEYCYARKAERLWPSVLPFRKKNLEFSKSNAFVPEMIRALKSEKGNLTIRIHESGDFYNLKYAEKWFEIMETCSHVKFFGYTKSKFGYMFSSMDNFNLIESVFPDGVHNVFNTISELKAGAKKYKAAICNYGISGKKQLKCQDCKICMEKKRVIFLKH